MKKPELSFDPSAMASKDSGIFGLPYSESESRIILLPVPWEVTTSYGKGTALGPNAVLQASHQVDLFDREVGKAYEAGYFMVEIPQKILQLNQRLKPQALALVEKMASEEWTEADQKQLALINQACVETHEWVYQQAKAKLDANKIIGVLGGDHSVPFGAIRAIGEKYRGDFGLLHIDAHADLRVAYQGFTHSHASIMYNVMESTFKPKKLIQVGIRDFSEDEFIYTQERSDIRVFFDADLKQQLLEGESWAKLCQQIIADLPEKVYLSFDIDGLDPMLCPNTGTPVPGGLMADQLFYLLRSLVMSGRKIIGFDLNEVSPGEANDSEWDANVGARMLYKLCGWTAISQGFAKQS